MILYGASGHAKVIQDILDVMGEHVSCLVDDNPLLTLLHGIPVVHEVPQTDASYIVSIGSNVVRRKVVEKLQSLGCRFGQAIHPSSVLSPYAQVGEGTVIMAGAIVNSDARIGRHCIINTGASIDHECELDDFVHVSPHATLCGNVTVGEGTWIGAGTTVIQGVKIGRWCVIGAGSVVTHDVPDGYLAVGNRCKKVKAINQDLLDAQPGGVKTVVG